MDIMLKNIIFLIESKYQSDIDFEKDFGIARSTVSAWRKGKLKSYRKMANDIAKFFNVSMDWLAGNEQKNKLSMSSESFSKEDIEFMNKISKLLPENRAHAEQVVDFLLTGQDKKDR